MTRKHMITALAAVLTVGLMGGILAGCGSRQPAPASGTAQAETQEKSGVICLKVNPEIAVSYDEAGMVTAIEGRNDDGKNLAADYSGYEGRPCRDVIKELVAKINDAGYFVEEADGSARKITLEIETGSYLPEENFLNHIVAGIQEYTSSVQMNSPVEVAGESTYGWTDYGDTDYGSDNDGVTDYNDTDYGPNNDGVTDYNDTDYGPNNDGVTDYNDTDYGPNNDGVTDYNDTDYGPNNDGVTDYNDTDYGPNNDGVTDYSAPAPAPAPTPAPAPAAPSGGDSGYGDSGYSDSGYGDSGYGDSGYDD